MHLARGQSESGQAESMAALVQCPAHHILHSRVKPSVIEACVIDGFGLGKTAHARLRAVGRGDVYDVDVSGEAFVLVLALPGAGGGAAAAEARFTAVAKAASAGAPVTVPLTGRDGAFLQTIETPEGCRLASLFPRYDRPYIAARESGFSNWGSVVARFHATADGCAGSSIPVLDLDALLRRAMEAVSGCPLKRPDREGIERLQSAAGRALARLGTTADVGLCHGEPSGENLVFDFRAGPRLTGFHGSGAGPRLLDIMWCRIAVRDAIAWRAWLAGYRSVRPLPIWSESLERGLVVFCHLIAAGIYAREACRWGLSWEGATETLVHLDRAVLVERSTQLQELPL